MKDIDTYQKDVWVNCPMSILRKIPDNYRTRMNNGSTAWYWISGFVSEWVEWYCGGFLDYARERKDFLIVDTVEGKMCISSAADMDMELSRRAELKKEGGWDGKHRKG